MKNKKCFINPDEKSVTDSSAADSSLPYVTLDQWTFAVGNKHVYCVVIWMNIYIGIYQFSRKLYRGQEF